MTKIIELILTHSRLGTGEEDDPVRMRPELYSKDGELVASSDPETGVMLFIPENINK